MYDAIPATRMYQSDNDLNWIREDPTIDQTEDMPSRFRQYLVGILDRVLRIVSVCIMILASLRAISLASNDPMLVIDRIVIIITYLVIAAIFCWNTLTAGILVYLCNHNFVE